MKLFKTHILLLLFFCISVSCQRLTTDNKKNWDEETGTFYNYEENLQYTLPTDFSSWAIAQDETTPEPLQFFGIDTKNEVCIGLFKPSIFHKEMGTVWSYSEPEVRNILNNLTYPDSKQKVLRDSIVITKDSFLKDKALKYIVERKLIHTSRPNDTILVYYSGFIFDNKNKNPYGIVVISSHNPKDTLESILLKKYYYSLTFIKH